MREGVAGNRVTEVLAVAQPPGEDLGHDPRVATRLATYRTHPGRVGCANTLLIETHAVQCRAPHRQAVEDHSSVRVMGTGDGTVHVDEPTPLRPGHDVVP